MKCNICNTQTEAFLRFGSAEPVLSRYQVIGAGVRQHGLCPACKSNDRERLVFLYLERKTQIFVERNIVFHVSPEKRTSHVLRSLPNLVYLTTDLFAPAVDIRCNLVLLCYKMIILDSSCRASNLKG
jgi:hypothetical protein